MSYRIGARVPESGSYACAQCGNTLAFEAGEEFPQCEVCFVEDAGEWDRVVGEEEHPPEGHVEQQ